MPTARRGTRTVSHDSWIPACAGMTYLGHLCVPASRMRSSSSADLAMEALHIPLPSVAEAQRARRNLAARCVTHSGTDVLGTDRDMNPGLPRTLGDRWETRPSFSDVIREPSNGGNTPRKHHRRSMGSNIRLFPLPLHPKIGRARILRVGATGRARATDRPRAPPRHGRTCSISPPLIRDPSSARSSLQVPSSKSRWTLPVSG